MTRMYPPPHIWVVLETNENLDKDVICSENEKGAERKKARMLLAVYHICGPQMDSGRG